MFAARRQGLDHDLIGELLGDSEARIAHLADDAGCVADEANVLFLAETHFSQSGADLGRGGEFLDANGAAFRHVAQRTGRAVGTMSLDQHHFVFLSFLFHRCGKAKGGGTGVQAASPLRAKETALKAMRRSGRLSRKNYFSLANFVARRDFLRSAVPRLTVFDFTALS